MATVQVRYIVNDVDAAIGFYCGELGFHEDMHPAPTFAMLSRGDLRLVLSAPGGGPGGGAAMPDGTVPQPGGWNRFQLEVEDLELTLTDLRARGLTFERFEMPGVEAHGDMIVVPNNYPSKGTGERGAFFFDSEGNLLALGQATG